MWEGIFLGGGGGTLLGGGESQGSPLCIKPLLVSPGMESLRRKRSALGAVTRIFNKMQKAMLDDPDSLDVGQLEHQMESVKHSDASYLKVHEEILDT